MDERIFELLKTLPPVVASITWDVANENITLQTIQLADTVSEDAWEQYEIVRCVAAGKPYFPPIEEAQVLLEMMLEALAEPVA